MRTAIPVVCLLFAGCTASMTSAGPAAPVPTLAQTIPEPSASSSAVVPPEPVAARTTAASYDPGRLQPPPGIESQRVWVHNVAGGEILGSRDGGVTWVKLGRVMSPISGGVWRPTIDGGVLAFNFLRGDSQTFATAVNAIHLRFSDPAGYQLPEDPEAPLVAPHAVSLMPKKSSTSSGSDTDMTRVALTDIPPGTSLFGPEWSPKVGSKVLMGDGVTFKPIPYDYGPDNKVLERSHILIITERMNPEIESLEFENHAGGKVTLKRAGEDPFQAAKVVQPVSGIGRFEGSEFIPKMGTVRANHPGVFCIGTTDVNLDTEITHPIPAELINELRGGFQILPSHHYRDRSMNSGGDHPYVYLVVGPIQDPPHLKRYDMGIDGAYPLFFQGVRAGTGVTSFKFKGDERWYDISDALALGKFKSSDGKVLKHLRGYVKDALAEVTHIRFENLTH